MQEFSSISVSSYEAESLSDRLTEQSAAGWSVVAVVPAGSQVVAYLSREASGDGSSQGSSTAMFESAAMADTVMDTPATSPAADTPAVDEPVVADPVTEAPGWATTAAADPAPVAATPERTPEPTPEPTPVVAAAAAAPAGWYADPSARYDLRYWDGSEWTEHVSRNGQQATDPPIA